VKIRRRIRGGIQESSAASDLAFLLIIYFLVIAGFNVNLGFLMNLPERGSTRFIQTGDLMRFEMDAAGNLFYSGAMLSLTSAEAEIEGAVASNPNVAVILSIDGGAPWQQVVLFVELAQKLAVDTFSFNMREET
jgi:biopolymer transport protein ExbD